MWAKGLVFSTKYFLFLSLTHLTPLQRFKVIQWLTMCYHDNVALGRYELPENLGVTSNTALYTMNILLGNAPKPFRGIHHLLNPTRAQVALWSEMTGLPELHVHELRNGGAYYIGANVLHAVWNHPDHPKAVSVAWDGFLWNDAALPGLNGELSPSDCSDASAATGSTNVC